MTEHLPECCVGTDDCDVDACQCCHACCICKELRACEFRVLDEYRKTHDGISQRYFQQIRNDALDAARAAVAAVEGGYSVPLGMTVGLFIDAMRREHLAAIDALKEER